MFSFFRYIRTGSLPTSFDLIDRIPSHDQELKVSSTRLAWPPLMGLAEGWHRPFCIRLVQNSDDENGCSVNSVGLKVGLWIGDHIRTGIRPYCSLNDGYKGGVMFHLL